MFGEIDTFYFYPRPPGGGRHPFDNIKHTTVGISIHALRVEGDCNNQLCAAGRHVDFYPRPPGGGRRFYAFIDSVEYVFLSTPSGWRATGFGKLNVKRLGISIHALRVEGDRDCFVR